MDEGGDHDGGVDHGDDRDLSGRIDVVRRVVPDVPIQVQTAAEPEGIPADPASEIRVVMFVRNRASPHLANLLQQRARAMRFSPTRSEEWLWRRLAGSKTGLAFRRQLVIGPFIVDFACTKVRLVVEVDANTTRAGSSQTPNETETSRTSAGASSASPNMTSSPTSMPRSHASSTLRRSNRGVSSLPTALVQRYSALDRRGAARPTRSPSPTTARHGRRSTSSQLRFLQALPAIQVRHPMRCRRPLGHPTRTHRFVIEPQ